MRRFILLTMGLVLLGAALPGVWAVDRLVPSQYTTIGAALAAAADGDRIVISGQIVEDAQLFVGLNNLTFTSGSPRADIRMARFLVVGTGIAFRDLDINGKDPVTGLRNVQGRNLVTLASTSANTLFENCTIINPASGEGVGNDGTSADILQPGTCVSIRAPGAVTFRNCDFRNDEDGSAVIQNEVCLHFDDAGVPALGPVLIEGCTFQAISRSINVTHAWENFTIRDCGFSLPAVTTGSGASHIYLNTDHFDENAYMRNILVENCLFGGADTTAVAGFAVLSNGNVENFVMRNCRVLPSLRDDTCYWRARGRGFLVEDNVFESLGSNVAIFRMGVRPLAPIGAGDSRLRWDDCVFRNNVFMNTTDDAIGFAENYRTGILVEDNLVRDTSRNGMSMLDTPATAIFRRNEFLRCGDAGVESGLTCSLNESLVVDNFFLDCQIGITIRTSRNLSGSANFPHLDRRTRNSTFARNIIIRSTTDAILDLSEVQPTGVDAGQGTYQGRPSNVRYVNNTIVNPGGNCMAVHGDSISCFNNILFGGTAAVRDSAMPSGPATTFAALGFNLTYNNNYQQISFPGGAPRPATDIHLTSPLLFAGGPFPTTRAGVTPLASSLAIDAGSSNGIDPDYQTDIGAIEVGAITNTMVPAGAWELYR